MPRGVYKRTAPPKPPQSDDAASDMNRLAGQQSQFANVDLSKVNSQIDAALTGMKHPVEPFAPITAAPPAPPPAPKVVAPVEPEKPKMFPVKLLYNYKPAGAYEPIGWEKPAVERKNAAGQITVVSPAQFIKGELAPAPYPGVGFVGKVWKGSTIGLPRDEALVLVNSKRAERADAFPA